MDKRFEGKTPEQILEMLTLEQKCGQLVSTGIGCWEECETAMEHHVGNLSVIYGHDVYNNAHKHGRKVVHQQVFQTEGLTTVYRYAILYTVRREIQI